MESGKDVTTIATAVEHRLPNPSVLLGVAAEFGVTPQNVQAAKLGIQATLGDF